MCRLLGLNAGRLTVDASFWLLDAPDSLRAESHRDPDGSGLGWFAADGHARVDKEPEPAFRNPVFVRDARRAVSTTFVSHIRMATTGARTVENTHPFEMAGRIMAQNGGFGDLDAIDRELGDYRRLVLGDTDSERFFALVTREIDRLDGDVGAGLAAAAAWVAENLPMFSLNSIVIEDGHLWALRYPDRESLHVLLTSGVRAATDSLKVEAGDVPIVVVASERLDDDPGWRMLEPGELLHVGPDLAVASTVAVPGGPKRVLVPPGADPNDES